LYHHAHESGLSWRFRLHSNFLRLLFLPMETCKRATSVIILSMTPTSLPFLMGAQYYRAPTPERACWTGDLRRMKELGMNSVKLWVQWRWSQRSEGRFVFDDVDQLMDLAAENGLQVTINTVFDVSPFWLFEKYPDAKQVRSNGLVIEPYEVAHRQVGGHPGPCYNHPGALKERQIFMAETVRHFRGHPALAMWDVWNEPELAYPQRNPNMETLACYCPHCQAAFHAWLKAKYASLERLNQVWGRCYETWEQVEAPRSGRTFTDFVDWREFHIDTMTREAAWRLDEVRRSDPNRVRYLHVVPNILTYWNSVTCASDDFDLAKDCQVFAATMNGGPVLAPQVVSAGRGKVCYNVESHINFGSTTMHQRILGQADLLRDWLPQVGQGIRGFLFWQFRAEPLGAESPAWGLVNLDGSDRPITQPVADFFQKIKPHAPTLMQCSAPTREVGIWKSRKNELFHFAMYAADNAEHTGESVFRPLIDSIEGYINTLYWQNLPYRIVNSEMLERGELDGIKLLIMPSPYYLTEDEARGLDGWVRAGGVLFCDAHLGGYNGTSGRHSYHLPGCGLAECWGIREVDTTSALHLKPGMFVGAANSAAAQNQATDTRGSQLADVKKAMTDFQSTGSEYFPILLDGSLLDGDGLAWGANRYARLAGEDMAVEGRFEADFPCLVSKEVDQGCVFYNGTNLGQGAKKDPAGMIALLHKAAMRAGVGVTAVGNGQVHVDLIQDETGPRYLVVINRSEEEQEIRLDGLLKANGLFSGASWQMDGNQPVRVPGGFIDLMVIP
jgi:beta-galactosidase